MFYVAEALLALPDQSFQSHYSALISAFGRQYAEKGLLDAKFHRWLIAVQNYRNLGDYGTEAHVSKANAESVCSWAEEFIQAAEAYLAKKQHGGTNLLPVYATASPQQAIPRCDTPLKHPRLYHHAVVV